MRFVLAGDLEDDRSYLKRQLQKRGAQVGSVVTASTDALFAGRYSKLSKTEKAEQLGVPVLGIAELRRMLEGSSLQQAVEEPAEVETSTTPFPRVPDDPRDGEYRGYYPGTDQLKACGPRVDGISHGDWTYFHPNGQVSSTAHYVRGLREGKSVGHYPDGTKQFEGQYKAGKQFGPWEYWYESGAWQQRYIYDDEGRKHGPYVWDHEDGSPRGRGAFWQDRRDGDWEWHTEKGRTIRGYKRGSNHGHEAGWLPDGTLTYSHHWHEGQRHGSWEDFYEDGSPKLRCTYEHGTLVGDHRTWDESGKETLTKYIDGLSEAIRNDQALHEKVVSKVMRVKSDYKKRETVEEAVEYSQRGAYLKFLWTSGRLELESIPELWEGIRWVGFTSEEVMRFLGKVDDAALKKAHGDFLPTWPRDIDELVCHAYDQDPKPFDEGWKKLPNHAKVGVAFVLARAGADRAVWGKTLARRFKQVVKRHVKEYGVPDRIWWWVDGTLQQVELFERRLDKENRRFALPRFYEFVELFGSRDAWAKEVLKTTLTHTKKERRVPWEHAWDGLPLATNEDLQVLLDASGYDSAVVDVFLELREDSADSLEALALSAPRGRGKLVALCAAKKRLDASEPVSEELLGAIEFDVSSYSHQWIDRPIGLLPNEQQHRLTYVDSKIDFSDLRRGFPKATLLFEVFGKLPQAQQRAKIEAALESKYGKTSVVPFLHFIDDESLWKRGIAEVLDADDRSGRIAPGLAMLPFKAFPLLIDAHAKANKKLKDVLLRAVYAMMARMVDSGELWDAKHDALIRTDFPVEGYQYEEGRRFVGKIVHRLPRDRAEVVLRRMFDPRKVSGFVRAMRFLPSHPTQAMLDYAMRGLLEVESSLGNNVYDITFGLRCLDAKRELIKWLITNGAGESLLKCFEDAMGHQEWPKLQEELKSEGVREPEQLDAIGKLVRDAKKVATGSAERIYALRPLDEPPAKGSLNIRYGLAPGVGIDRWPMVDDEPMTHMFTLDLKTVGLANAFRGKVCLSLFVLSPDHNEAWEPHNGQTRLVFSDATQVVQDVVPPEIEVIDAESFEVVAIDIPLSPDKNIRAQVYGLGARVGGEPIWLQAEEHFGNFLLQFDSTFVGINLGDMGLMYVFEDTAFWQCH